MKKQDKLNPNKSHNVYYDDNYRIRIYRNDKKLFEKQMKMPKLTYYNLYEEVQDILCRFIEHIGQDNNTDDKFQFYTNELMVKLNSAYAFASLLEELRNE